MLNAVIGFTRALGDGEQLDLARSAFSDFTRSWTCATACLPRVRVQTATASTSS